ncbi:MAG: hypothetical protein LCI00_02245 [Chloroflexi bacterium]|nr:hypothetical protein [Chloroflexota bacterium]MCC6893588.1 hypothetical protein [Anaerolineae bacterium]
MGKIRDTLIGLWPVIKTYVPKPGMILAVIIAFLIGLLWSYAVDPVVFYDSDPRTLGQTWQDEWVRLIADRYDAANSRAVITDEFRQSIVNSLNKVDNPQEIVNRLGLGQLTDLAAQAEVTAPSTPPQPTIFSQIRPWIVGTLAITLGYIIGSLLFGFYINPIVIEPIRKRIRGAQGTDAAGAGKIHDIQEARKMRDQLAKDAVAAPVSDLGPPVVRHVSIYNPGRAYDDSFSIEDEKNNDEFLGECGAVISETIGAGQPEKVTAIEIWLFDKEDFVRTLTTVFVSEHAYNDPALRAKLSAKGELVIAKPGAIAKLETNTLRLNARIVDMAYGTGPLPPNSYFDKMTVEIQAWRKAPGTGTVTAAPMAVPVAAVPVYSPPPLASSAPAPVMAPPPAAPMTYAPPASAPTPFSAPPVRSAAPQPYSPPAPAVRPPPIQSPPPQPDDDIFGGSGDFTPVN